MTLVETCENSTFVSFLTRYVFAYASTTVIVTKCRKLKLSKLSKTTISHVHQTFWYILFPLLYDFDVTLEGRTYSKNEA